MAAAPATRCAEKQERLAATAGSARATGDWHCAEGVRGRRLSPKGRRLLVLYAVAAAGLSVLVMRSQALEWSLIIATVVVPMVIAAAAQYRLALR